MSYYHYMQSVYTSTLPELNRTLRSSSVARSSSVTRTTTDTSEMPSRFTRAATVGPTDFKYNYVSAMPFTYQYDCAVQRMLDRNLRATSVAPSNVDSTTYSDAYTRARGGGYSAFDYKVIDYANRLDKEESTRSYINERKYEATINRASTLASRSEYESSPFRSRYNYYDPIKHEHDYMYNTYDVGGSWKHYRLSNSTLEARTARAKSPIVSRELDRYYKTERRSSFIGDVSSGANRDFRYYSYRPVPYFGGSDYYSWDYYLSPPGSDTRTSLFILKNDSDPIRESILCPYVF